MRVIFIAVAVICAGVAVVFLLRQNLDAAFVAGTLGVVAWFLSYRVQLKRIIAEDDPEHLREDLNENADS